MSRARKKRRKYRAELRQAVLNGKGNDAQGNIIKLDTSKPMDRDLFAGYKAR